MGWKNLLALQKDKSNPVCTLKKALILQGVILISL